MVAAPVRGRRRKNVDHSRPVVTKNLFAPLRAIPMEGAEMCGETPSSDNLEKGRPPPIVLTSEVNFLSLQKYLKAVVTGEFFQRRKRQRMSNQGSSGRTFFSKYTTPERSFASALRSNVAYYEIPHKEG
jgi:hypothetical protein